MADNATFTLESTSFSDGCELGVIHTCEGANATPGLIWKAAPDNTVSFALICDDPDAPTAEPWVHWVVYNMPASRTSISGDLGRQSSLPDGTMQGLTTLNHIGYDGPCPPGLENHRYIFTLFALDTHLNCEPGLTKNQLLEEIQGHILAQASIIGTYKSLHKHESDAKI